MRTFLIALASALLLAFIVIQLNVLLFADDQLTTQHHLSLLVLTVIALLANGLFNANLAQRNAPGRGRGRERNRRGDKTKVAAATKTPLGTNRPRTLRAMADAGRIATTNPGANGAEPRVPEAAAFVTIANRSLLNEAWRKSVLQIQFPSLPRQTRNAAASSGSIERRDTDLS